MRERWADHVNERLGSLDIDARIDHRSLEAQGIDLEPQHKIGPAASRMAGDGLAPERVDEHRETAHRNGEKLLANPELALDAITHGQATFTRRDAAMFVHRHSESKEQFHAIMAAIRTSDQFVYVGKDGRGEERFTSRAMLETEQRLKRATWSLAERRTHGADAIGQARVAAVLERSGGRLSAEQRGALKHVTSAKDLAVVVGYAGTGKSTMLGVAREMWEGAGYRVQGAALSGIAAENLEEGSGIASRTLASLEHQWAQGRELLGPDHVLVIDEAGMIGSGQMERVVSEAERRGAKVVLVGDPEQLQAIEAGGAFRAIAERHGAHELVHVRRQREGWQRAATRMLATERTAESLQAYGEHGALHAAETREAAREALVDRWDRDRVDTPGASRIILTHLNDEVQAINVLARERMKASGDLGEEVSVRTDKGERRFAAGDRIMFLRNERSLGVKNGSLGRVDNVTAARMAVLLDDGRSVAFDLKDYANVDHGYAATVHKAQGMTVDKVQVLATPGLDRHAAYVALSRHRDGVELHYGRDDFADQGKLVRTLSRERAKDMASDYVQALEMEPKAHSRAFADLKLPSRPSAESRRGMFDGLALKVSPDLSAPAPDLGAAVQRYARAFEEVEEARRAGREAMPHQHTAVERTGTALDRIQPDASRDLAAAIRRDPRPVERAKTGDAVPAMRAMQVERDVRLDPARRAQRFVDDWRRLDGRARKLADDGDYGRAETMRTRMGAMVKSLQRDPQLESLLRNRTKELGIGGPSGGSISHDLAEHLGLSRGRGIGR